MIRCLIALSALLCVAASDASPSPAELYGPLFQAVQRERVFADGKTFVDATPKRDPTAIMTAFHDEQPRSKAELRTFVEANFTIPGSASEAVATPPAGLPLRAHIRELWPILTRPPLVPERGSSALALSTPYVVPGGRFREIYYWDSYFTMLGLKVDGEQAMVESMLSGFVSLIQQHGHIPNGTRTYYLSRSQPPFFALMLDLSETKDPAVLKSRLDAARAEHRYWMAGTACLDARNACKHVVRMPDGSLLNRYWDARDTPRDESFAEDIATADAAPSRPAAQVYRHLRAGAESGWDFSSRWLSDQTTLATIHTTDIVPADLNALVWAMERTIAARCLTLGDMPCATDYAAKAAARHRAIDRYLWFPEERRYADWDRAAGTPTQVLSAATLYPLFVGLASTEQAKAVVGTVRAHLLAPGGLRTTGLQTGEQWDAPNGWAPLQWVGIVGLQAYGETDLAGEIARRWLATVSRTFCETGKMLEKYDVEKRRPGGGGEYPLQDGFGWTNGVTSALLARYPGTTPKKCAPHASASDPPPRRL